MLIDTHCHLHDREFFSAEQAEEMLKRAADAGVERVICIGTSHDDSLKARQFASEHENVYWTYGIHPSEAGRDENALLRSIFADGANTERLRPVTTAPWDADDLWSTEPKERSEKGLFSRPIGIGEVGLDYHYEGYDREAQIRLFEEMLQLALDNNLPVSFHVREAFADFFPVVANFPGIRGVVHSFTDSKKVLKRILTETEFYVGVNGLATYSTLPTPPMERILLETDAPFLAPVPHRGETNEPAYIRNIAEWLAGKLEMPVTKVARITTRNAISLFGLE